MALQPKDLVAGGSTALGRARTQSISPHLRQTKPGRRLVSPRLAPERELRQYFWPLNGKHKIPTRRHKILTRREVQWNAEPQVGLVLICRWRCRWWLTATRARRF